MGQLLPAKVLADKNISSNKINSVSKIVKTKSAISQVTGSNVDKINSSEATKKDSTDTNNHLISNSENTYKLSTIGNGILLGNNGRVVITATKVIKNNIYVQLTNDCFRLDLENTQMNNPNYIFKENGNQIRITPLNNNLSKQIILVVKAIKVGNTDFQIFDNQTKSNKLRIDITQNKTPKALEINPEEFEDGITNWIPITKTSQAEYVINDSLSLAFTFGKFGGNTDIPTDVLNPDPKELMPNVYLLDKESGTPKYINAFFTHSDAGPHSSNNYGIVTSKMQNPLSHNGYNGSGNSSPTEIDKGAGIERTTFQNDKASIGALFEGQDSQGRRVLKKVVSSPKYKYDYEILYRFNLDTPVVQQEMYFKNTDTKNLEYGAYLTIDTQLNSNDNIDLYAQGDNAGLYMQDQTYKLNMNTKVSDGPVSFAASPWPSLFGGTVFRAFKPQNITGSGFSYYDPAKLTVDSKQGDILLKGYDSQYTNRWDWHSLAPGGVDHYRQDIGIAKAPYVVPYANKSYTNKTSGDGENHVGDTVKFNLSVKNQGYNSSWGKVNLSDTIPAELELDTDSIKLINSDGTIANIPKSAYNTATRELSVDASKSILDNQTITVTFDAKILSSAGGRTIRNTFYAKGIDEKNIDDPDKEISASAFVDIPVLKGISADMSANIFNRHDVNIPETRYVHNYQHVNYEFGIKNKDTANWHKINFKNTLPTNGQYIDGSAYVRIDGGSKQKIDATLNGSDVIATYDKDTATGHQVIFGYEMEIHPGTAPDKSVDNNGAIFTVDDDAGTLSTSAVNRNKKSFLTAATKILRNETTGTDWAETDSNYKTAFVFGKPGDIINYKFEVGVSALNSEDLDKGVIQDVLDKDLELVPGTAKITYPSGTVDTTGADQFTTDTGYSLKEILDPMKDDSDQNQAVTLEFSAKVKDTATNGEVIKNTGSLLAKNPLTDVDNNKTSNEANVIVSTNTGNFNKQVRNVTNGTSFKNIQNASVGDEMEYQLNFKAPSGNTSDYTNALITDILDSRLDYKSGSLRVLYSDGSTETLDDSNFGKDGLVQLTHSIKPGDSFKITFKTTVNSTANKGDTINNYGSFKANGTQTKSNNAQVVIKDLTPEITKKVALGSSGVNRDFKDEIAAYPGQSISYLIRVDPDSDADAPLEHLKIKDQLPTNVMVQSDASASPVLTIYNTDIGDVKLMVDAATFQSVGGVDVDQVIQKNLDDGLITTKPKIKNNSYYEFDIPGTVDENIMQDVSESDSNNVHIDNVASIVGSTYGDLTNSPLNSNTAIIDVSPMKSIMTKEVKEASDNDSKYAQHNVTPLETSVGDELNYRVTIKPDSRAQNAHLSNIKVKDDFNGNLGSKLTLNKVKVSYFNKNNVEYTDRAETYSTADIANLIDYTIPLKSNLLSTDYVQLTYDVTINKDATEGILTNTAYITQSSYGTNTLPDNKRDGWYSNNSNIQINNNGQIIVRYVDRKTNELIKTATPDNTGQEVFTDRIGNSKKVQPKDLGQLGYTVVDSSDINDNVSEITDWKQPATDYDLNFDKNVQVITYRYEKSRIGLVVPILWDFGKFNVASADRIYFLDDGTKKPQSVNVIDYYTTKNWKLSVKQLGQFKGSVVTKYPSTGKIVTKDYYLDNAQMHLNNGNVTLTDNDSVAEANKGNITTFGDQTLDPNATQPTELMTTNFAGGESNGKYATHGFGVWHYNFGDKNTADHSIGLHIPQTTKRKKIEYKTKLEWTLTVAE